MPDSMSSTMMRLALVRLVFANDFTRRATRELKKLDATVPVYTVEHIDRPFG